MIGVLDWGIGGLFATRVLREREPSLDLVYLADTGSAPYGTLSRRALSRRVDAALGRLASLGATRCLVACHSASTVLPDLDRDAQGVLVAPPLPAGARVGVLGGRRTVASRRWRRLLPGHVVQQRVAQPLSAAIEAGQPTRALVRRLVAPLQVDVLLLACTHYVATADELGEISGLPWVDPALEVARALPVAAGQGSLRVFTTGEARHTREAAARLGERWQVDTIELAERSR